MPRYLISECDRSEFFTKVNNNQEQDNYFDLNLLKWNKFITIILNLLKYFSLLF
jgi:hypothetical protein